MFSIEIFSWIRQMTFNIVEDSRNQKKLSAEKNHLSWLIKMHISTDQDLFRLQICFSSQPFDLGLLLAQTTDPIMKQSCYIQSTIGADLNLWVEISKSQIGEFVWLIQISSGDLKVTNKGVCVQRFHSRGVLGFETTCSYVSKYYMR